MGGLLIPTAALLRSLQWVSDGRSRGAEPRGCDGRWLCHVGAAQCPVGTRLYETHCKLRSSAAVGTNELPLLPYHSPKGDVWLFVWKEVLVNRQPTLYVYIL